MASLAILVFLVVVLVQVVSASIDRLMNGGTPRVFPEGIALMTVTLIINIFVVWYELATEPPPEERGAAGRRQAHAQRRADVDRRARRAARRVVGLSRCSTRWRRSSSPGSSATPAGASRRRRRASSPTTSSFPKRTVRAVVQSVPEVLGCEKIRTRGVGGLRVPRPAPLARRCRRRCRSAHATSHVVKDRLMTKFPAAGGRRHPHRTAAAGQA